MQRGGAPTDCFLEGPSFDRAGNLFVVDVAWGRIFRIAPDGRVELFTEYDGEPNGLKTHRDGRIFITDYRHGLMLLDPTTRAVTPFLERKCQAGCLATVFFQHGTIHIHPQPRAR